MTQTINYESIKDLRKDYDYVVFYTNGDKELGEFLNKRANKLGYHGESPYPELSVTLGLREGDGAVQYTIPPDRVNCYHNYDRHIIGDLEKFLKTDHYRFDSPFIYIGDYRVRFFDDGIKFREIYISKEDLEKIMEYYNGNH